MSSTNKKFTIWIAVWKIPKEIWSKLGQDEKNYLKAGVGIIMIFAFTAIIAIPFILTQKKIYLIDFTETGEIGDTIGGITSPFIGIIGAILTFLAFYVQYKANEQQKKHFEDELSKRDLENAEQEKTWKIDRFENKFYRLLELHKGNTEEIRIKNIVDSQFIAGKNSFQSMYHEFKYTFYCCKKGSEDLFNKGEIDIKYDDVQLIRLAYIFFYCGVEDESDVVSVAMNQHPVFKFDDRLFGHMLWYLSSSKQQRWYQTEKFKDIDNGDVTTAKIEHRLWDGHQRHLGHYYRHLFQTVKFVTQQSPKIISKKEKLNYLRSVRAQLSDFEQIMLYYNALANFGGDWITEGYFTSYKMIHNIPLPLANFGIRPQEKFAKELKNDPSLFEWLE